MCVCVCVCVCVCPKGVVISCVCLHSDVEILGCGIPYF